MVYLSTLPGRRFVLHLRDVATGRAARLRAKFVMVTHGILAGQYTLQERGMDPGRSFMGAISLAGREGGKDCAVSRQDLRGKASSGASACARPLAHLFSRLSVTTALISGLESTLLVCRPKFESVECLCGCRTL